MMKKNPLRRRVLRNYWPHYTFFTAVYIFVLLPMVLYLFFFNNVGSIINNAVRKQNETYLNDVIRNFNETVRIADMTCQRLQFAKEIRYFLNGETIPENQQQLMQIQEMIREEVQGNDSIYSIYVYYRNQNVVVTGDSVTDTGNFNNIGWYDYGKKHFGEKIITPVWIAEKTVSDTVVNTFVMSVVWCFPVYTTDNMGVVAVNIDVSKMQNQLKQLDRNEQSMTFIKNSAGTVEVSGNSKFFRGKIQNIFKTSSDTVDLSGKTVQYNNNDYLFFGSNETYFGWSILQAYPVANIKKLYSPLRLVFHVNLLISAVLFIFLLYAKKRVGEMSYVKGKPVQNILDVFKSSDKAILHVLFDKALNRSDGLSGEQIDELAMLDVPVVNYVVLLIKLFRNNKDGKETELNTEKAIEVINGVVGRYSTGYCVYRKPDEFIAAVHITREDLPEVQYKVKNMAAYMKKLLSDKYQCGICISIGKFVDRIENLSISLEAAGSLDKYIWFYNADCIVSYDECSDEKAVFVYNRELEEEIIKSIRDGNESKAVEYVKRFIDTLITDNGYSPENIYQGMLQIVCAIFREVQNLIGSRKSEQPNKYDFTDNMVMQFMSNISLQSAHAWLNNVIRLVCDYLWDIKGSAASVDKITQIREYINENLDKGLTLGTVAEAFGISESYLSRIFKQNTGENYLEYLNKSRINRAKQILKETSVTISEVSSMAGFDNVQTFIRVFKSIEGITPGVYRAYANLAGRQGS